MMSNKISEKRRGPRKRMLKGGTIAFSGRHATLPCVVRNMSDMGARLQVQNSAGVPDTFELLIDLDGCEASCSVVWRKPSEVGVSFLAEPTIVPPKRAQVVEASQDSAVRQSVRRRPVVVRDAHDESADHAAITERPRPAPDTAESAAKKTETGATIPILIADDDPDDRLLIEDAFRESKFKHPVAFVENGEELLEYLRAEGKYRDRRPPGLILLDLNMPRMDGRTALIHIKADRTLRRIPVIILTTSSSEQDIQQTYDLGISAYIPKPGSYTELVELVRSLESYWMRFVALSAA